MNGITDSRLQKYVIAKRMSVNSRVEWAHTKRNNLGRQNDDINKKRKVEKMNKKLITKIGGIIISAAMAMSIPMVPTAVGLSSVLLAEEQTTASTEQSLEGSEPTTIPTNMETGSQETIPTEESTEVTSPSTEVTVPVSTPGSEETVYSEGVTVPTETVEIQLPSAEESAVDPVTAFVNRCYEIALGRTADAAGREFWRSGLAGHNKTAIETAYGFLFSTEYTTRNPSNETFVNDLYRLMLGRNAEPTGKANWLSELNKGTSRQEIFAGFANSVEFRGICDSYGIVQGYYSASFPLAQSSQITAFALRMYTECLGRDGENAGISEWTRQLIEGRNTGIGVAYGFFFSAEFLGMELTPVVYTDHLYGALLGRSSDAEGLRYWELKLKNGASMESVFAGFANSNEFKEICSAYGISRGSYTAPAQNTHLAAPDPELLTSDADIFALKKAHQAYTSIPTDFLQSVKIPLIGNQGTPVYEVEGEQIVQVDANGVVTPKLVTYYWVREGDGAWATTDPTGIDYDYTTQDYVFGTVEIKITVDGYTLWYEVELWDYAIRQLCDEVDAFIASSINDSMTTRQKVDAALTYVADFGYDPDLSALEEVIISGSGNENAKIMLARFVLRSMDIACRDVYHERVVNPTELIIDIDGNSFSAVFGDATDPAGYYNLEDIEEFIFYDGGVGGSFLFAYYGFEKVVTIPATADGRPVTKIDDYAFSNNDYILGVTIPSSVKIVGNAAFRDCYQLTNVTIQGTGLTEIGNDAFCNCLALETINIPNSLTTIGAFAFNSCKELTSINLPGAIEYIGDATFLGCESLTSVVLPANLTEIDDNAFAGCTLLAEVTIPSKVTRIGQYAFGTCSNLARITIPPTVTTIETGAFEESNLLTIYGATGSAAHTYAVNNVVPFQIVTF